MAAEVKCCVPCSKEFLPLFVHLQDTANLKQFLIEHNLLHSSVKCPQCEKDTELREDFNFTCRKLKIVRTGNKTIVRQKCRFFVSSKVGSFFDRSHLSFTKVLQITYWFLVNRLTQKEIAKTVEVSPITVNAWFSFCREVVETFITENNCKIGGPNKIVEVDEAKFGKRGRVAEGIWAFGGIERDSRKTFMVTVNDRTKETLFSEVKKWIEPGTTIISDCWEAYKGLELEGYKHQTVSHSEVFVDPEIGAKRIGKDVGDCKPRYGGKSEDFHLYLDLHFFIKKFPLFKDRFHNFLLAAAKLYPPKY